MLKKSLIIGFAMVGTVVLALASSGGGGNKKKQSLAAAKQGFTPLKSSYGLTLKAGPNYTGSHVNSSQRKNILSYNTLVTYQKGNTIFILPYKYKLNTSRLSSKNNLNVLDLKINFRK
ncbi:MAG: hypothetical protein H7122_03190 [Chitinophagaceae bacterium]|nr:hypothetical protein [Chitinophagaceae bacterium]